MLILSRVVQAFGGGAAEAVVMAMVKDMYTGRKRELVLAVVMAMVVVAPVVAPVIGAIILKHISWNAIFWVLAGVGDCLFFSLCSWKRPLKSGIQAPWSIPSDVWQLF